MQAFQSCTRAFFAAAASVMIPVASIAAQGLPELRAAGAAEVKRFVEKTISVTATLVSQRDPAAMSKLLGGELRGCPSSPLEQPKDSLELSFSTGRLGPWAGDLDGINITLKTPLGETGNALAIPSVNPNDLPGMKVTPRLEFAFDGTLNVERALIDRISKAIDKCLQSISPGEEIPANFLEQCGIPVVERSQAGQTCVLSTYGSVTPKQGDQSSFDVVANVTTMCDFIGYGSKSTGNTNTGFTTCYVQEYRGAATVSDRDNLDTSGLRIRKAVSQAYKRCSKAGKKGALKKRLACTMKGMSSKLR